MFKKETALEAKSRIREAIRRDNHTRVIQSIVRDGFKGYKRDKIVYKEN